MYKILVYERYPLTLKFFKGTKRRTVDKNTFNERIRMLIVCLVSFIPCPLFICLKILSGYFLQVDLLAIFVFSFLTTITQTVLQCSEEIILLAISKEFRKLVKRQFVKNSQTNVNSGIINVSKTIIVKPLQN
ncbi:hypothetical protein ACQ4LE_001709 [Meloidogyne hapla]